MIVDPTKLKSLVNVEYIVSLNTESQLRLVTAGPNQQGWRLLGRDDNNYDNIGNGAVDFSYSGGLSSSYGASGDYSFAEGIEVQAEGEAAHAEGYRTLASGEAAHAEGTSVKAEGDSSHAEGYNTVSNGKNSHAEGNATTADSNNSHAEGYQTIAGGYNSHAEGNTTEASGNNSHTEGKETNSIGTCSHAGGYGSDSVGANSQACGLYAKAIRDNSTAIGMYNTGLLNNSNILEVGIGTSTIPENALEVTDQGVVKAPSFDIADVPLDDQNLVTVAYLDLKASNASQLIITIQIINILRSTTLFPSRWADTIPPAI